MDFITAYSQLPNGVVWTFLVFSCAFARAGGLVFTMPVINDHGLGLRGRLALAASLGILLGLSCSLSPEPMGPISGFSILIEYLKGMLLGLGVTLAVSLISTAVSALWQAHTCHQSPPMMSWIVGSMLFLSVDGDHFLIRALWMLGADLGAPFDGAWFFLAARCSTHALLSTLVPLVTLLAALRLLQSLLTRTSGLRGCLPDLELGAILILMPLVIRDVWPTWTSSLNFILSQP